MSLKNFLRKLWSGISRLFHGLQAEVKKITPIAVQIVDQIKTITDSHIGDVLTAIIPGHVDDDIRDKLRNWLPKTILTLGDIETISHIEDPSEQLKAILAKINVSPDDKKKVFYHGLASLIVERLGDGKLDWSDATAVSEYVYQHEHPDDAE